MTKSFVIILLCLSSVYSDPEMKIEIPKDGEPEKIDNTAASVKSKRFSSWPIHSAPCPLHWPHYHQGWHMPVQHKVHFAQSHYAPKPAVTILKSNAGWNNPWHQNYVWSKPSHDWPMPSSWNSGWQSPGLQSGWKSGYKSTGWNKPVHSYAPSYHKPSYHVPVHNSWIKPVVHQPDCPPWEHSHPHTGIVYAPQHQYHHQPQIVKVVKPLYHQPQPVYNHVPSFHHPVHHLPHHELCD